MATVAERLRIYDGKTIIEAANLIDLLTEALKPFATPRRDTEDSRFEDDVNTQIDCTIGDLRKAQAARQKAERR